jgi:uncharacterized membrane protein YhaH (DUF805 family)
MRRSDYWLKGFLPLLPLGILNNILAYGVATYQARAVAIIIGLISLWPVFALVVKRLHDRNHSGWFALIFLIPIVGPIWLVIEVIFLRGTTGPNRFGDDPLQTFEKSLSQDKIQLETSAASDASFGNAEKICPDCAKTIKLYAVVCRFCGHKFSEADVAALKKRVSEQAAESEAKRRRARLQTKITIWQAGGVTFTIFGLLVLTVGIFAIFKKSSDWIVSLFFFIFGSLLPLIVGVKLLIDAKALKRELNLMGVAPSISAKP